MEIFCFFIGILYLYTLNSSLLFISCCILYIKTQYSIILFFILGVFIAWIHQWLISPTGIPDVSVIPYTTIQGTIVSIPQTELFKTQFLFALERYDTHPAKGIIQLAWYNNKHIVHAGQKWQFTTKLKKPRNYNNPGSADYVSILSARHVLRTGIILSKNNQIITASQSSFWLKLREHLGQRLTQLAPNQKTAGVVEALTLNLTNHISKEDWDLFRKTGTIHLFGISGEHIALISGVVFWLSRWIWSRSARYCLYIPAPYIASICGLVSAILYAFLAGFAPPVQRALIGCFFYTLCSLGKQRFSVWQVWRYALFGVLCIEPHAVLMQGFYFSFLAVACLLITQQRWQYTGYKARLALQLSCLIGLLPLTIYWYSYGSINGFVANLFAIPLVGFLIVPIALITMLLSATPISGLLMNSLSLLINLLFKGLFWVEHLEAMNINWSIYSSELTSLLISALLMYILLPIKPFQWIAVVLAIIPFFPSRTIINSGEALIHVLDVGQGLAVVVRTQHHLLLYDTGDQFFQGSDLGQMVILPYFKKLGINNIDTVVISHPDKDHRGGFSSIKKKILVKQLLVNDPQFYHQGIKCHNYPEWQWDGVQFRFFSIKKQFRNQNNNSCILQISTLAGKILFTGDIEQKAEDYLIKIYGKKLLSDYLIVPHHGSKTSSSYRFLLETKPKYAIASLGFDNRFHFPHAKTLTNLQSLNIPFYRTDECGMVQITLPKQGELKPPTCFKK